MKIAWITTPESSASRVGRSVRGLLPHLREHATVELFVEPGREQALQGGEPTRSIAALRPREYDQILYSIGNEAEHAFMAPLLRHLGGTVQLFDWQLPRLARAAYPRIARPGLRGGLLALRETGSVGLRARASLAGDAFLEREPGDDLPAWNRSVTRHADAFVVHSAWLAHRLRSDRNAHTPIAVLGMVAEQSALEVDRNLERARLGLGEGTASRLIVSTGGLVTLPRVRALATAAAELSGPFPGVRIALCGPDQPFQVRLQEELTRLGRASLLLRPGGPPQGLEEHLVSVADVVLQLGGASVGAGTRSIALALRVGCPLVVSEHPEFAELPEEVARRVRPGDPSGLAAKLGAGWADLDEHQNSRQAVLAHARSGANPQSLAEILVERLARFPAARSARRPLVSVLLARGAQRRATQPPA